MKKFYMLAFLLLVFGRAELCGESETQPAGVSDTPSVSGEKMFGFFARNNFAYIVWNGVFFTSILGAAAFGNRK